MNQQLSPFRNRPQRSIVADAASGLGSVRPPHISRRGNRFTLVDAAGNTKPVALIDQQGNVYVDVVFVDANPHPSRMFFDGPYREDNPDPPACWSDNGLAPSSQAAKPQAPTCAVCPQSAWGSKISALDGKAIPACQSSKKLAVVVVGDDTQLVYEFVVPPGSWNGDFGWKKYMATLRQHNVEAYDVVTRISFVPNSMGVLQFMPRPGNALSQNDPHLVAQIEAAWESGECPKVCGMLDVPRDSNLPLLARPVAQEARPAGWGQLPPPPPPMTPGLAPAQPVPGNPPLQGGAAVEPPKRTRRTKAEMEAARAAQGGQPAQGNGQDALDIPPFLQRAPQAPQVVPPAAVNQQFGLAPQAPIPGTTQFGLQQPQAPDKGLQDALAAAFNLPTT